MKPSEAMTPTIMTTATVKKQFYVPEMVDKQVQRDNVWLPLRSACQLGQCLAHQVRRDDGDEYKMLTVERRFDFLAPAMQIP